jgi:lysozyme family protein
MIQVVYNAALREEYQKLFFLCHVRPERVKLIDGVADKIVKGKDRYDEIAKRIGCPWWVVGLIHNMECGLRFDRHLHNGDPLTDRTKHVPSGRPAIGKPPFTFADSACDALTLMGYHHETDWTIGRVLYLFEKYNGLGYRQYHPDIKSPYLWSFTNWYSKGKYVADGKFDHEAVSQQIGIAAILKRMQERNLIAVS